MHESRHSSLVLIRLRFCWNVSSLAKITLQNPRKKKQEHCGNATPSHTSNCTGQCLQLHSLTHGEKDFFSFFFFLNSPLFLCDAVSGWLSAIARMELWDTAWPLTWTVSLSFETFHFHLWQHEDGKDKEEDRHQHRRRQADRQVGKGCLWWSWTLSAERGGGGGVGSHRTS